MLDLRLGSAALAGDGLLHLGRRVLEYGPGRVHPRHQGGASRLTQFQGGGSVAVHEHLLDGDLVRPVAADQIADFFEDNSEALGKAVTVDPDAAAGDVGRTIALGIDDAKSGDAGARVNTQDAWHARQSLRVYG